MKVWTIATIILLMATTALSAGPGGVLGPWKTDGGDAWLELFECGEEICGTISWLKVPNYVDSNDGPVGKTKVDRENRDPALRNRPILGLQIKMGSPPKVTTGGRTEPVTTLNPARATNVKCTWYRLINWSYVAISGFHYLVAPLS